MFDENKIKRIKEAYPKGTEIELISMEDSQAVPSGTRGVVDFVDDIGTIFVDWENGSSLGLVVGEDQFKVIKRPNPAIEELKKIKINLAKDSNENLSLFTYNKNTGNKGVASFSIHENKIIVFEGNPDGSDDTEMTYEEFIDNYQYAVANEYENPFENISI